MHCSCTTLLFWPARIYIIFMKKKKKGLNFVDYKICVLIFSTNSSEKFIILRWFERDMIENLYWSPYKVFVILLWPKWNLNFLDRFWKNTQKTIFTKIRTMGNGSFNADRRTNGEKDRRYQINSCYSQFCECT
jgi:hypothetical protein